MFSEKLCGEVLFCNMIVGGEGLWEIIRLGRGHKVGAIMKESVPLK